MNTARDLLCQLISIPSVNPMGRPVAGPEYLETRLTAFLEDWLRPLSLELRRQPVAAGRDNLLATYHAPQPAKHILLEVHQDTVPTEGMVIPPFAATIEGNRIYGRGACDNKGPMTAMLLALRRLVRERPATSASVTLALTVDEEHTFLGAQELVRRPLAVDGAIVAEPTDLDLVISHKGVVRWDIVTPGKACHSSAPNRGVNAIYRMARVLQALEKHAASLSRRPADPLLGPPSLSVGRIEGGVCVNMVPDFCRIEIDRRVIPGEDPLTCRDQANAAVRAEPGIDFEVDFRAPWFHVPPVGTALNGRLTEAFRRTLADRRPQARTVGVPYGTDAGPFTAAGIPCIVFGPGSIAKAHTEDEWVPLDEVELASEILFQFCADRPTL